MRERYAAAAKEQGEAHADAVRRAGARSGNAEHPPGVDGLGERFQLVRDGHRLLEIADARAFLDRSRCTVLQKPFELTTLDEHIARLTIPLPPS